MSFPFESYQKLSEAISVYHPAGEETLARWISESLMQASELLQNLLQQPWPVVQVLLVRPEDWHLVPSEDPKEEMGLQPYLSYTDETISLAVPLELDPLLGEPTQQMLAFMLYHELVLAFLENDPRPWPEETPLWADEWQLQFAAIWLVQQLNGAQGIINKDLYEKNKEIFEPEPDGKTPVTIRGFDWFEDTTSEDYLTFELLLEQFAVDLLARYSSDILPRFLEAYRGEQEQILSDDATTMLAASLGQGGSEWLENLVYF